MNKCEKNILLLIIVLCSMQKSWSSDITPQAFGSINDVIVSAFGDFNSDELTDV